jgi:hypothetical protein
MALVRAPAAAFEDCDVAPTRLSGVFEEEDERPKKLRIPKGALDGREERELPDISRALEAEKYDREKALEQQGLLHNRMGSGIAVWEPNDKRWDVRPPFGFSPFMPKFGGYCCYCAGRIFPGERGALYSRKLNSIAHATCQAGRDD